MKGFKNINAYIYNQGVVKKSIGFENYVYFKNRKPVYVQL